MSKIEKFEKAIIELWIGSALEYFATPKELYYLYDHLKIKENHINDEIDFNILL